MPLHVDAHVHAHGIESAKCGLCPATAWVADRHARYCKLMKRIHSYIIQVMKKKGRSERKVNGGEGQGCSHYRRLTSSNHLYYIIIWINRGKDSKEIRTMYSYIYIP